MTNRFQFNINATDGRARTGVITTPKGENIDININAEDDADDNEIRIVFYGIKTFPDGMKQTGDQFDTITINKLTGKLVFK